MSKWKVRNIYTLWSNIQFHVQKESIWAKLRKLLNLNFRAKPNIHYSSIIEFFLKYFDVKHFILFCNFWTRCIILFQCGPQEKWPRPLKKHWRSDQVKQMQFSKTFNISVETFENWRLYSPKKVEVEKSTRLNSILWLSNVYTRFTWGLLTHYMEKYRSGVVYSIYGTISKIQLWILQNCKKTKMR